MNPRSQPSIAELHVGDEPGIWEGLGFVVEHNRCRIGTVDIVFTRDEPGIHGWVLRHSSSTDFAPYPPAPLTHQSLTGRRRTPIAP